MFNKFMKKAVANTKDCRPALTTVHYNAERGEYVATNGHIMLVEKADGVPFTQDTQLEPSTGTVAPTPCTYPDYWRVIPAYGDTLPNEDLTAPLPVYKAKPGVKVETKTVCKFAGFYWSADYLRTIAGFFEGVQPAVICEKSTIGEKTRCIMKFTANGKTAIIINMVLSADYVAENYTQTETVNGFAALAKPMKPTKTVYLVRTAKRENTVCFAKKTDAEEYSLNMGGVVDAITFIAE